MNPILKNNDFKEKYQITSEKIPLTFWICWGENMNPCVLLWWSIFVSNSIGLYEKSLQLSFFTFSEESEEPCLLLSFEKLSIRIILSELCWLVLLVLFRNSKFRGVFPISLKNWVVLKLTLLYLERLLRPLIILNIPSPSLDSFLLYNN